ncbi:helix-turn-helix domain-containing protein [Paraburkholderia sp.]|uniref:helix-turn-helix domain-containing protein n=1 Tax=Paraburkholderia sp. TaxID=1926495 RepID=UPI003C79C213
MSPSLHQTLAHIEALSDSALLTPDEAAAWLRLSPQTLANDRATHRLGIPFARLGRAVRYPKGELSNWRNERTVRSTAI